MRLIVLGGTGHIGSWLVPQAVLAGHDVVSVSRGQQAPYMPHPAWRQVRQVAVDRRQAEADGSFGDLVARLAPDAVADLTCFTVDQARHLVDSLDGQTLVHTGSIWSFGPTAMAPVTEDAPKHPVGTYGIDKLALEHYLLEEQTRVRASVVMPGHISGPGWLPIGPTGNRDPEVIHRLRRDGSAVLPDRGLETIHHVHAADVAALHLACLANPDAATGETFASVCTQALTLRGFCELVARHFGHEPDLQFLPWAEWAEQAGEENAEMTLEHIGRAPMFSMAKAERVLGFTPAHPVTDTVLEAIDAWLAAQPAAG